MTDTGPSTNALGWRQVAMDCGDRLKAAEAEAATLRAALETAAPIMQDLTDDLTAGLDAEYGYKLDYPSMRAKYERDMEPVNAALEWLAKHASGDKP